MKIAEIIKLNDTLKDYCDRLDTAIALARNRNCEVKLSRIHAENIRDMLERCRDAINNTEIKGWGQ